MKKLIDKLYIFNELHHFKNIKFKSILLFFIDIIIYFKKCITSNLAGNTDVRLTDNFV